MNIYIITSDSGTDFSYEAETRASAIREHTRTYPREAVVRIVEQSIAAAESSIG